MSSEGSRAISTISTTQSIYGKVARLNDSMRFLGILLASSGLMGCTGLFYYPAQKLFVDPHDLKLKYDSVRFDSSDGKMLAGWFFSARLKKGEKLKGTIVQFHGNAENRSTHFFSLIWLIDHGYNLFTFDYRGYDGSEGSPSEEGTYRDGMAAIRFIKSYVHPIPGQRDLIFYGQSLGGAILARCYEDVIDRSRILSLVIESSFYSYQAIAENVLSRSWITWLFQFLGAAFVSDQYSPEKAFAQISPTPLLVIHGLEDRVIPPSFGEKIYQLANEPKTLWLIPKDRHLTLYFIENGKYRNQIVEYWNQLNKFPKRTKLLKD